MAYCFYRSSDPELFSYWTSASRGPIKVPSRKIQTPLLTSSNFHDMKDQQLDFHLQFNDEAPHLVSKPNLSIEDAHVLFPMAIGLVGL